MAERAIPIDIEGLDWDTGAPQPIVISSERRAFIVFYGPGGPERDEVVVSAEFVGCVAIKSGFPNEDVLHGHSLWGHGLSFYRVHEVRDSAWIAELAAIESVHYLSPAVPFTKARHFVLTFHDSTVEAVASDLVFRATHPTQAEAVRATAGQLST